ncbi:hypothetical protein [Sutcliffiella horikoshii]|uniref:Uncharacterized protein n=1 Tax=Sutcliffiella horikoshii TaxID=79883 RepID=A0A5D4TFR4_9BACI|nr:hypothetical protein [Sutcliffiella horikoshii]TYS72956.1 hypothetical protein FZC75_07770 [Sutcliffiella horikoshii]
MTVFNIFALDKNNPDQINLFNSKADGRLDLGKVADKMVEFTSPILDDGMVDGEEFLKINITHLNETTVLEAFATGQGSLGYYTQAYYRNDEEVNSKRKQQRFFSKAKIFLLETNYLIVVFEDTTEEKIKSSVKKLVESLGFELSNFRLSDVLMRSIRSTYTWNEVRLEKVDNDQDSTKKVHYEIDVADGENESLIDSIYKDQGKMVQLSFEMPSKSIEGAPNFISVRLYRNDHRIVINNKEFPNAETLYKFIIHLSNKLIELEKDQ